MTGGFIRVNQALARHFVDLRYGFTIAFGRRLRVALIQRLDDLFHRRAHARFERDIVLTSALRLPGTFGR